MLGRNGSGHPAVSGYSFDDHWDDFTAPNDYSVGPTGVSKFAVADMGLDTAEVVGMRRAYA